jgi:hypothetical protein
MFTPETLVKAWMASSGHKRILLQEDATHIGVGFAVKPIGVGGFDAKWTLIVKDMDEEAEHRLEYN